MIDDPFELYRRMPSHQARLASEKQVNVYFVPGTCEKTGNPSYLYCVSSALLHESFVGDLKHGVIPDYAVIVATGYGEPEDSVKSKMNEMYGFDHAAAESNG